MLKLSQYQNIIIASQQLIVEYRQMKFKLQKIQECRIKYFDIISKLQIINRLIKMNLLVQDLKKKIHIRNNDFFLKNYKSVQEDIERDRIKQIVDVELQCLGYGIFKPKVLLDNFAQYIFQLINVMRGSNSLRSFKITINGFTLDEKDGLLQRIAKEIPSIKQNLSVLWIRTANLKNVTLKDFNQLLRLSHHLSDINFQDFTLQCANWTFTPTQPSFKDLRKIFQNLILESTDITKILNKHFRLEMSGWYYTVAEARAFLGFKLPQGELKKVPQNQKGKFTEGIEYSDEAFFKQQQKFFLDMQRLIKQLLNVMDNIEQLQLDMRNTHQVLKLKNLKKRLDNLTKDNRYEKSLISKRMDVMPDDAQKQLKLTIVM